MEDNKNMKRKWYHLLIFLGVVGAYIGLLSCGKSKEIVDVSTVLLERGQHIIYGVIREKLLNGGFWIKKVMKYF